MSGYDAFISYSHAADDRLATALRDGLQQLARPWNRRRALNVFLDKAALEVSAGLKSSLQQDLAGTEWLIVLLSERSAASPWVAQEIAHWAATKSPERIMLVHTDGELRWAGDDWDFDASTAAPRALSGVYDEEPLWLDLRRYRDEPDLDIRTNAAFRDDLATLAAPMHGISKEELVGADLTQYRKARRLRRIAVALLAALTVAATVAGVVAFLQRQDAVAQARRAESRAIAAQALAQVGEQPDLAALLALESLRVDDTGEARGSLLAALGSPTRFLARDREHAAPVAAAALHPAGSHVVTGDEQGLVVIRAPSGDPIRVNLGGPVAGLHLVARAGGHAVEAVGIDGTVVRWSLAGEELARGRPATAMARATLGRAGHVAGVAGGEVVVYRLAADLSLPPDPAARIPAGAPTAGPVLGDGDQYVAWSEGASVAIWEWASGEPARRVDQASAVNSLAFASSGAELAIGGFDGTVTLVDAGSGAVVAATQGIPSVATAVAVAPGGASLVSAHNNGDLQAWDLTAGTAPIPVRLPGHRALVNAVALGADGRVASGSRDGDAILWRAAPAPGFGRAYPEAGDAHTGDVIAAAFVDDGTIVSSDRRGVLLTGLADGTGREVPGSSGVATVDAAAGILAVGAGPEVGVLRRGAGPDAEPLPLRPLLNASVFDVELADDGSRVAAAAGDDVAIWDPGSGELLGRPELPDGFLAFSVLFGQRELWVGGNLVGVGPAVVRIDPATMEVAGEPLPTGGEPAGIVLALAESPDGSLLATGGIDRTIATWNTTTLEQVGEPFVGHKGSVNGLVFVDGGARLIAIDGDEAVAYWDVAERRLVAVFRGPGEGIHDLAISPDGSQLAVASSDGHVWVWPLATGRWLELACELAGRNMDDLEWHLYGRGERVRHCPDLPGEGEPARYPVG